MDDENTGAAVVVTSVLFIDFGSWADSFLSTLREVVVILVVRPCVIGCLFRFFFIQLWCPKESDCMMTQ